MSGECHLPSNILPLPQFGAEPSFVQVLNGLSLLPSMLTILRDQQKLLSALREEVASKSAPRLDETSGWLDAKAAAKYLGLSPASFDKYRYQTTPKIKGYKLDGKALYKRSDLDSFVMLYELKSGGVA